MDIWTQGAHEELVDRSYLRFRKVTPDNCEIWKANEDERTNGQPHERSVQVFEWKDTVLSSQT